MIKKNLVLWFIFSLGLIYVLLPGPKNIEMFPPLPQSVKSTLVGDTIQNPNIAAYYSDYRRDFITYYYKMFFESTLLFGLPLPAIIINHPPEEAYQYVRDQQESTFLEEYVRPLRESIFVNGYEPLIENLIFHKPISFERVTIRYQGTAYRSKTTLRYYPTSPFWRVVIYLGIWVGLTLLYKLFSKALKEKYVFNTSNN